MSRRSAAGLLALAALLALVAALAAYLRPNAPISDGPGARAVVASTLFLLVAAAVLAAWRRPGWLTGKLAAACLIDVLTTAVTAWFVHAWVLLGLMLASLVAWLLMAWDARRELAA